MYCSVLYCNKQCVPVRLPLALKRSTEKDQWTTEMGRPSLEVGYSGVVGMGQLVGYIGNR